ncbi:MAG TPA: hypothetical protein VK206_01490 [Anaerolineales bacterium]|nr:hypothetical protein [Anaerolineales bacterium]
MVKYRQNKSPFAIALGDWFPFRICFLTSKASPNDQEIVIVVIIIVVGEAKLVLHIGGIIAQFRVTSINFENQIAFSDLEIAFERLYPILIFEVVERKELLMKLRYLFIVDTVVALVFAAGLLLAPKTMLNLFGLGVGSTVKYNASINLVAQLLGAALVVPGLLSWFGGGMEEVGARRSVAVTLFIFSVIGFGVSFFVGMLPKVMSAAGWAIVALFLFFAAGFAYFLFMRSSEI